MQHIFARAGGNSQRASGTYSANNRQVGIGRASGLQGDVRTRDDIAAKNIEGLGTPGQPGTKINQHRTRDCRQRAFDFNGICPGPGCQGRVAPCGHNTRDLDRIRPLITLDQKIAARHQVLRDDHREIGQSAGFDGDIGPCRYCAIADIQRLHRSDLGVAKINQHCASDRLNAFWQTDHIGPVAGLNAQISLRLQQASDHDAVIAAAGPDVDIAACCQRACPGQSDGHAAGIGRVHRGFAPQSGV